MKKILVFGKHGQLATGLRQQADSTSWIFLSSIEADFLNQQSVVRYLEQFTPDIIINACAYTAVDKAESEKEKCFTINAVTPAAIANWCKKNDSSLLHFSTDYVYPGNGNNFWIEDSQVAPLNHYGLSKLEGERLILATGCHSYIFRTSWIYSPWGHNFVKTMLRLGMEKEELSVVCDQIGSPTSAFDLASCMCKILSHPDFNKHHGVYNLAGEGVTSWYEFSNLIFILAREMGKNLKIHKLNAIPSSFYPTPAIRPQNSRMDQAKIKQAFGIQMPPWQSSLRQVLSQL